ncbi:MAG: 30S ribosomal protein S15 [Elusimicrobia bacterium]|nr:30S ribosomal protein S15 [Elusimicrobiota bacterium]MBI2915804.1 30S ribosomal protein S15 [Elusimicrobiota bacterium]MBI3013432.1 30S ribosomal protein S15 [Elusimicrobiota bacterium]MBI4217686.1 30S ribosomal protein S15 [Elusimicrobiota bacterium]
MSITKEKTKVLVDEFKKHPKDTGNSSTQVAILTERIQNLTEHLKDRPKDFASRQGLFKMVGKRRRLLNYVKSSDQAQYQKLIQRLDLRK